MAQTFVLIDALNLIRRIWAVCESQSSHDEAQLLRLALTRTEQALNKLLQQFSPHYCISVFDGQSSWRHEYYPQYKHSRKPMPALLQTHLATFAQQMKSQGVTSYCATHDEADDIIATLAHKAQQHQLNCIIVSTDKGYLPLLAQGIQVYDYFAKAQRSDAQVKEKYAVPAALLWQFFALVGDATNDIVGVKGIGKKTAAQLLNEHQSVALALKNDPTGKTQQRLSQHLADYTRALQLVSLRTDIDVGISLKQLRVNQQAQIITANAVQT